MKVKCPRCKEIINLDINEHEEGDEVECQECGERCIVLVNEGKFKLITERQKFLEESDDFDTDDDE
ncbi:MAG: hypothetical protein ABIA76_02960 [Candidatus Diapherotrites archaeon]